MSTFLVCHGCNLLVQPDVIFHSFIVCSREYLYVNINTLMILNTCEVVRRSIVCGTSEYDK